MGGGNPLKRIEKEVNRSYDKTEAEVSRAADSFEGFVSNIFSSGGGSTPAPVEEEEEEIIIDSGEAMKSLEQQPELKSVGTKSTKGYFSDEGRQRLAQTKSGVGSGTSTSGLGY